MSPKILIILATILFLTVSIFGYHNKLLSFHFVDEEDNFIIGKYLLSSQKIYSDLFSHHQPLAYTFSAGIQKATNPNSVYLLIKKHRQAVIAWSVIWLVILVAKFGIPLLLFVIVYELNKYFLLGNLFLAESLVVYPLAFLISLIIFKKSKLNTANLIFTGLVFGCCLFLLSTLWPLLLFLFLFLNYQLKWRIKDLGFILLGIAIMFVSTLPFMSIYDYFINAFYINFKFYIPMTNQDSIFMSWVKAFLTPFTSLFINQTGSAILIIIQILAVTLIFNSVYLIKIGRWKDVGVIFFILSLANIRYVQPGLQYFSGFHMLPWLAILILAVGFTTQMVLQQAKLIVVKVCLVILITSIIALTWQKASADLLAVKDLESEYYINYSRQVDFGKAVKIMKKDGDKLFIAPAESLIYWEGDLDHAAKEFFYYAWMSKVPKIKLSLQSLFTDTPPTFFYCDCKAGYFGLEEFFSKYQPIYQDGKVTKLLVLQDKVKNLSSSQKEQLAFYRFSFK